MFGKERYKALEDDIFNIIQSKRNKYDLEERVQDFLDRWEGDTDRTYDIVEFSNKGNRLRYALQEHIIAHKLREKGYDSVLSYSKHKGMFHLSELFDLRQMEYPDESGFVVENIKYHNNTHTNTLKHTHQYILTYKEFNGI